MEKVKFHPGTQMSEVVQDAQQEFWRPPVRVEATETVSLPPAPPSMAETCSGCGSEFMIGSRFCHTCGAARPEAAASSPKHQIPVTAHTFLQEHITWLKATASEFFSEGMPFPSWLRYL